MKLDFPVMLAALLVAAAVQVSLPVLPFCAAKVQFLPAVALYYALARPWQLGAAAALWAGILTDALAALPRGATAFPLLVAALVVLAVRDPGAKRSALRVFFIALPFAAFVAAAQRLRLAAAGTLPLLAEPSLPQVLLTVPLSALLAAIAYRCLSRIDLMAENVSPFRKEQSP